MRGWKKNGGSRLKAGSRIKLSLAVVQLRPVGVRTLICAGQKFNYVCFFVLKGQQRRRGRCQGREDPQFPMSLPLGNPANAKRRYAREQPSWGGSIPLCDVQANALKQFRNTGAIRRVSSSPAILQGRDETSFCHWLSICLRYAN